MLIHLQKAVKTLGPIKTTAEILRVHPRTVIRMRRGKFHPQLQTIASSLILAKALVADAEALAQKEVPDTETTTDSVGEGA